MGVRRYVITGPPGSGKTTWSLEHAKPGDIVFDLDVVVQSLTRLPNVKDERLHPFVVGAALGMRRGLCAYLEAALFEEPGVFIIVSDPTTARRVADQVGAKLHRMPAR